MGGWETTRNGCLQRQRVALWSLGAAQEQPCSFTAGEECHRPVTRQLARPVSIHVHVPYIALTCNALSHETTNSSESLL